MAKNSLNHLVPTSAFNLGVVRAIVSGVFLVSVLLTSFSALGQLPVTLLRPIGLMKLLPWEFYDLLVTPRGMVLFQALMVLALTLTMLGFVTSWATKVSLLLVVLYQGLVRSFGHFNHDEMIAVYFLFVLAFTPCGDAFSFDSRLRKRTATPGFRYAFPIFLMMILLAWVYFSSAVIKIRAAGSHYFSPENLPALAIYHSLDNLHGSHFKVAFLLPRFANYLPAVMAVILLWELLFPLAVFWRRSRVWILAFGILFHLATLPLMNIFFPHQLAMYAVFVDWSKLGARIAGKNAKEWAPVGSEVDTA